MELITQRKPKHLGQAEDYLFKSQNTYKVKTINIILTFVLLSGIGAPVLTAQNLDKMRKNKRESLLIATAKEVVMKYGPDYYRDYKPPVIERYQVPPKGERNPTGEMAGKIIYRVIFLYDKTQESLEWDLAARVSFREDTGKPAHIFFGNNWGREVPENWRNETIDRKSVV